MGHRFTIGLAWSLFRRAGGSRLCSLGHDLNLVREDSGGAVTTTSPAGLVQLGLRRPWVGNRAGGPHRSTLCVPAKSSHFSSTCHELSVATAQRFAPAKRPSSQARANGCGCPHFCHSQALPGVSGGCNSVLRFARL
jgi:hypothetical protein